MPQETSANSLWMLKMNLRVVFETHFVRGKSTNVALSGKRFLTFFSQGVSVVILNIQRRGFDLHVHCNHTYTLFSASKGDRVCNANFDRLCFSNEEGFKWRLHTKTRPFYRSVFVTWRCRRFFWKPTPSIFQNFRVQRARWLVRASSKSGAMTMPRMFSAVREILVDGTEGRKM